jgi:hypothetical protein
MRAAFYLRLKVKFSIHCTNLYDSLSFWTALRGDLLYRISLKSVKRRETFRYRFFTPLSDWIGHILRRNCLLKHVIEGKLEGRIEMTGRRGRRRKQLLDDLKEKKRYCKLKEEALDRTLWRTRCGRGYGPVVRQTAEWMNGDERLSDDTLVAVGSTLRKLLSYFEAME